MSGDFRTFEAHLLMVEEVGWQYHNLNVLLINGEYPVQLQLLDMYANLCLASIAWSCSSFCAYSFVQCSRKC